MFKKILLTITLICVGTLAFALSGATDNWNFKIPQDMSGQRVSDINLSGCEYYTLTTTNCINITSDTYRDQMSYSRYCPVEWEALVYGIVVSTNITVLANTTNKGYVVIYDTTSAIPDNTTKQVLPGFGWTSTNDGVLMLPYPVRCKYGICAQIDTDNTLSLTQDPMVATIIYRRIKKN